MTSSELNPAQCKEELSAFATKLGAVVTGVADPASFSAAPDGHRPADLLPGAKSVFVIGGGHGVKIFMQILPTEGDPWLGDGGLQQPHIPYSGRTAVTFNLVPVNGEDSAQAEEFRVQGSVRQSL